MNRELRKLLRNTEKLKDQVKTKGKYYRSAFLEWEDGSYSLIGRFPCSYEEYVHHQQTLQRLGSLVKNDFNKQVYDKEEEKHD